MEYTDMERRILDMWPKFEDGSYVMYEDEFDFDGEVKTAYGFNFGVGGRVSICSDKGSHVRLPNGEHVKRPAPKVLDADGVEIKVGDRVYSTGNGNSYIVRSVNGSGAIEFKSFDDKGWSPKCFTHIQPAIDADGVPIKVGDTVWSTIGESRGQDVPHEVKGFDKHGCVLLEMHNETSSGWRPEYLTHTRPDSWERLERDAEKGNCEYLGRSQSSCDGCYINGKSACDEYVRIDLVRRAKALAEKEAAR